MCTSIIFVYTSLFIYFYLQYSHIVSCQGRIQGERRTKAIDAALQAYETREQHLLFRRARSVEKAARLKIVSCELCYGIVTIAYFLCPCICLLFRI